MRLPRFVILQNPAEITNTLIMETRPPFVVVKAVGIPKKDAERVEAMLADIANGRKAAVKVPGFTVFLTPIGSLGGGRLEPEAATPTLREMAGFYLEAVAARRRHKLRVYEEGVPDDIDERNGRRIREAGSRKIWLDQK